MRPCRFPRCPALADKDRDHCPVHYPERVVQRAAQIVINQFTNALMSNRPLSAAYVRDLMASIVHDLEHTV